MDIDTGARLFEESVHGPAGMTNATRARWVVALFMWLAIAINYIDRTVLAAAAPSLSKSLRGLAGLGSARRRISGEYDQHGRRATEHGLEFRRRRRADRHRLHPGRYRILQRGVVVFGRRRVGRYSQLCVRTWHREADPDVIPPAAVPAQHRGVVF